MTQRSLFLAVRFFAAVPSSMRQTHIDSHRRALTMRSKLIKRAVLGAVAAAAVLLGEAAQAALQPRDLDGDAVTDAFYDTDLNLTWLRNANVNRAPMTWFDAVSWSDNYSFGGYSDWRLPTTQFCFGYNCGPYSELAHLWYVELGNTAGSFTNAGDFLNMQPYSYWTGTQFDLISNNIAIAMDTRTGVQFKDFKNDKAPYAMAVRDGDVAAAPVPEPQTYALLLAGLAALVAVVGRRRPGFGTARLPSQALIHHRVTRRST
jgi:hypothetical protein